MKINSIFLLYCIIISLVACCSVQGKVLGPRQKRALAIETCPKGSTADECKAYAIEQSKRITGCFTYILLAGAIEWRSCGTVGCAENMKLVEDLTKPYPECCGHCKDIPE